MGATSAVRPVLTIVAAFSRYEAAIDWGRERCRREFGDVALESESFAFTETNYYDASMGAGLVKRFFAFERLADPGELPRWKLASNEWEDEYCALGLHSDERPLNLDPGYLTEAKLVLASTKDHHHRLYLAEGIYGEVTLCFQRGQWREREWTYPNYRRADYHAFFTQCRDYLRSRLRPPPSDL